ncbi:hypothetical protein PWP92_05275 [Enterobacter hormaechei subsp. xiangfangensis]|uniref:hypothetical protein n=1 Tax=Enterobacter hormaechei TaxID=158836 RepID=UPI0013A54E88|nr:hypothetical protein [Enterobacter hormaechei]MDE4073728.1 hypothetical protein [Enterobacter hormaechei subsp. xiangfangensis]
MSTITKEHLRERALEKVKSLEFAVTQTAFADSRSELEEELELARIALASLEAEAVGYMNRFTGRVFTLEEQPGADTDVNVYVPVYAAPPAQVSVPDEVSWEDVPEEITEDDMEVALAWAHGFNQCRAAMLQGVDLIFGKSGIRQPTIVGKTRKRQLNAGAEPADQ